MAEHTPTPWFKNSKFEIGPRPRTDDQHDGMLHPVADVFGDNREADAAHIVKCVNAFPDLVMALEKCAAPFSTQPGSVDQCQAEISAEFQRRMDVAGRALAPVKGAGKP